MSPRHFAKYVAFARIGFTEAWSDRSEIYARSAFLGVILGIFSALWRAVAEAGMPLDESPRTLVWYLATTEWILLSAPQVQFQIEDEVRRGDVAYQLSRPGSYVGCRFAQALGMLAARAPVLLAAAGGAALLLAGGPPRDPMMLLYAVPFGLVGAVGFVALNIAIGLFAFWLGDIAPLHWVVQKLGFVLGGLMLPLELYPRPIARLAALTPFPCLLYGPASFLLSAGPERALGLGFELCCWLIVTAALSIALFRRAAMTMQLNGG
jgi:ABC-2 type transport system permease protein